MSKSENINQQQIWFIYVNQQSRGPMGLRDIDVLLRTNQINSRTFCWKNGMKQWKPMVQIDQIKQTLLDSSNQIISIQKGNNKSQVNQNATKNKQKTDLQENEQQDQMIQNQDQNPLSILQVTVQNLLKKSFHQSTDGKWSIYDEQKQEWVLQDEQPIEKINKMKNQLVNKLKSQFFADAKNKRKFKHNQQANGEPQKPLTKEQIEKKERNKKKAKRAAQKKKQKWYQAKINTFVYISGLPFDITQQQLKEFASKAGVLRMDLSTGKEKLKIYRDQTGLPKGDAAVSYARQESVDIAIQVLNDSQIRQGFKVKVQRAHFNQKDEQYKRRDTKKQNKVKKIVAKKNQQKQFAWDDDIEQKGQGFRIVIMKYVFTLQQASNQNQMQQIKSDIASELSKIGEVKRLKFYDTHPDGVVQIKFEKDVQAQKCIQVMNGRFFDGRQIICDYWDGQTDYKIDANSIALQQQRLMMFANQLEQKNQQIVQKKQEQKNQKMLQQAYFDS